MDVVFLVSQNVFPSPFEVQPGLVRLSRTEHHDTLGNNSTVSSLGIAILGTILHMVSIEPTKNKYRS